MDKDIFLFQLTVEDFKKLLSEQNPATPVSQPVKQERNLVYGYEGLAKLLGVSRSRAITTKNNGSITGCYFKVGHKLVFDADAIIETLKKQKQI